MATRKQRLGRAAAQRMQDFLALKARHALSYAALAGLTGFHLVSLKRFGSGTRSLSERNLNFIRLAVADHRLKQRAPANQLAAN